MVLHFYMWYLKRSWKIWRLWVGSVSCTERAVRQDTVFLKKQWFSSTIITKSLEPIREKAHSLEYQGSDTRFCSQPIVFEVFNCSNYPKSWKLNTV